MMCDFIHCIDLSFEITNSKMYYFALDNVLSVRVPLWSEVPWGVWSWMWGLGGGIAGVNKSALLISHRDLEDRQEGKDIKAPWVRG